MLVVLEGAYRFHDERRVSSVVYGKLRRGKNYHIKEELF